MSPFIPSRVYGDRLYGSNPYAAYVSVCSSEETTVSSPGRLYMCVLPLVRLSPYPRRMIWSLSTPILSRAFTASLIRVSALTNQSPLVENRTNTSESSSKISYRPPKRLISSS